MPKLTLRDLFAIVTIVALALGVSWVAADAARRLATLNVFFEGHGVPTESPPQAFEDAEWNASYLVGLVAGVASGVGISVAVALVLALRRRRAPGCRDQPSPSK